MTTTPNLGMTYIDAAQAQKHVTHNSALDDLDVLVQSSVTSATLTVAPGSPSDGDAYIVAASATGTWAGHDDDIAAYQSGAWAYHTPAAGWVVWNAATGTVIIWDGTAWVDFAGSLTFSQLGINATADTTNRLSVASDAVLFNHNGSDSQVKVNKNAATDDAGFVFQDAFSTRALFGLLADDDFTLKVSPDGSSFVTALTVDKTTGHLTGDAVQSSDTDTTAGRLMAVGAFGLGEDADTQLSNVDTDSTSGFYYGFGGAHASATPGTNPFPTLNGAFGLVQGTCSLGSTTEYLWQIAFMFGGGGIDGFAWRAKSTTASGWSTWQVMFGRQNVLGTVSQSSGTPTGAVIERGSNANGEYVRFADGTQICTQKWTSVSVSTTDGSVYIGSDISWTYPASFVAGSKVAGGGRLPLSGSHAGGAHLRTNNTITGIVVPWCSVSVTTQDVVAMAIGRWF